MSVSYYSRWKNRLDRWTTPPAPVNEDEVRYWQDRLLLILLLAGLVLGFPVYVASIALCIKEALWSVVAADTAIYGWVALLFFRRSLPFSIRAASVVYMSYALGIVLLLTVGPFGSGPVWLFAFPVLSALFMKPRTVYPALAINAVTIIAVGFIHHRDIMQWPYATINANEKWAVISLNFMLLNAIVAISVAYISRGLMISLKHEKRMLETLEQKHDELVNFTHQLEGEVNERRKAEAALRESEEKFSKAFHTSPYAITITRAEDGKFIEVNDTFSAITGFSREEALADSSIGINLWVNPEDRNTVVSELLEGRRVTGRELAFRHKNGQTIKALFSAQVIHLNHQTSFLSSINDITGLKAAEEEKARLEQQFIQAQKMESVGRLAGGVAHDFNNMLAVILGRAELALFDMKKEDSHYKDFREIQKVAERSADLTRQLLAFARRQTIAPKVLDLNVTVEGMLNMLRRLIGENIDLLWRPAVTLCMVKVDPAQVDQVLANLCVNARDAIDGVGKVTIETDHVVFDKAYCDSHNGFLPGEFVLLAVSDDGCGMSRETVKNIFEPFFTTKELGKGTGLGLATVYGIVKQNNGFINVYSEPGHGTTFKIYLPRRTGAAGQIQDEPMEVPAVGGNETVLMVEDDEDMLNMGRMMLETLGYQVLTVSRPAEAIRVAEAHAGAIQLMMTDVIMPEMNGRDLAKTLLSFYPNLKCLYMSGYTADVIAHHGVLDEGVHFIQKPFSTQVLAEKVRKALYNGKPGDCELSMVDKPAR